MNPLRNLKSNWAVALFITFLSSSGTGATIQGISDDGLTFSVRLSRDELTRMPWRGSLLAETSDTEDHFVAPFDILQLIPEKNTVIMKSREILPKARRLMVMRFLPIFWDTLKYPWLVNPSQLKSFEKLHVGGGGSFIVEAFGQRRSDREQRRLSRAAVIRADLVAPLTTYDVGFHLSTEYMTGNQNSAFSSNLVNPDASGKQQASQETQLGKSSFKPGLWTSLGHDIRLGLNVEYTLLKTNSSEGSAHFRFTHELVEPGAGLSYSDHLFEGLLWVKMGASSRAKAPSESSADIISASSPRVRTPAETWIMIRSATSDLSIWGLGMGYIFYRTPTVVANALMPKIEIKELLRLKLSFEKRLFHGDKIQALIQYDGARTPSPWIVERFTDTWSVTGGYQREWVNEWTIGSLLKLEMGQHSYKVGVEKNEEKIIPLTDKISSLGSEISFYIQKSMSHH